MTHTIHHAHRHAVWDNSILPVLTIVPGEKVELDIVEASDGQVTLRSTARDIDNLNPARANPVTGPVYVDGAQPGDALRQRVARRRKRQRSPHSPLLIMRRGRSSGGRAFG